MNPWLIIGALVALFAVGSIGYMEGHQTGVAEQKAADQAEFDHINRQIGIQKAEAEAGARKQRDGVIALQAERDKFKSQLGAKHVESQDLTRRLADAYAAYSLRFQTPVQDGWCGDRTGSGGGAEGQPPGNARTATVQLPDALTEDLRQLAREADEVNDDYRLCHGYVSGTKE